MASLPPQQQCCATGFKHSGTPAGSITTIDGTEAYIVGPESSTNVLIIFPDAFGLPLTNTKLIADGFSNKGFLVFVLDMFEKDPLVDFNKFYQWLEQHMPDKTAPIAKKFAEAVKAKYKPEFFAAIGHCYGARPTLALNELFDAVAVAHPSFVDEELVRGVKKPLMISAAEFDPVFTDELRYKTLNILKEIKAKYYVQVFSGTEHGYAVRGDPNNVVTEAARQKTWEDQLWFFKQHGF